MTRCRASLHRKAHWQSHCTASRGRGPEAPLSPSSVPGGKCRLRAPPCPSPAPPGDTSVPSTSQQPGPGTGRHPLGAAPAQAPGLWRRGGFHGFPRWNSHNMETTEQSVKCHTQDHGDAAGLALRPMGNTATWTRCRSQGTETQGREGPAAPRWPWWLPLLRRRRGSPTPGSVQRPQSTVEQRHDPRGNEQDEAHGASPLRFRAGGEDGCPVLGARPWDGPPTPRGPAVTS